MRIGVAGAGTMGAGIAQLGALAGFETLLYDPDAAALAAAERRLGAALAKGAERERWSRDEADAAAARLRPIARIDELAACDAVIEAAPERLEVKRALFRQLEEVCGPETLLATNTSSLSVGAIAAGARRPERICGMHFFNPPPLMRLVELVAGERSAPATLARAAAIAERMGREPVRCADSVGFIVNRCNRPFTLEALAIVAEGGAGVEQVDGAVRELGEYPMGPFELIDLVGVDVNLEVARSFYDQRPLPRWRPHPIQAALVEAGRLGRKAGRGFYEYGPAGERLRALPLPSPSPAATSIDDEAIHDRIVAQLVNEACFALAEGVATSAGIDRAMRLGLNHPRGPFEAGRALGPDRVLALLEALRARLGDDRYAIAGPLRSWARSGGDEPAAPPDVRDALTGSGS